MKIGAEHIKPTLPIGNLSKTHPKPHAKRTKTNNAASLFLLAIHHQANLLSSFANCPQAHPRFARQIKLAEVNKPKPPDFNASLAQW